jgi:hypothetical protein
MARLFYLGQDRASLDVGAMDVGAVDVAAMTAEIRSAAEINRVFVFPNPLALIVGGRPVQIRMAEGTISNFVPHAQ